MTPTGLGAPPEMPPEAAPTAPPAEGGQVRQATQEEQQMYNQFVGLSMTLLYDKKFMQTAIERIGSEQTVMEGVARVAALVAFRVFTEGKKQGRDIPASVVVHAGMEVVALVDEMAHAAGFDPMSDEERELAYYGAADQFREMLERDGQIDPAQLEADRVELEAMQKDGRLANVMAEIQSAQSQAAPPLPGMAPTAPQGAR